MARQRLLLSGTLTGALAGGGIDVLLGGASLALGAGIGAVVGGVGAWFGGGELTGLVAELLTISLTDPPIAL